MVNVLKNPPKVIEKSPLSATICPELPRIIVNLWLTGGKMSAKRQRRGQNAAKESRKIVDKCQKNDCKWQRMLNEAEMTVMDLKAEVTYRDLSVAVQGVIEQRLLHLFLCFDHVASVH